MSNYDNKKNIYDNKNIYIAPILSSAKCYTMPQKGVVKK